MKLQGNNDVIQTLQWCQMGRVKPYRQQHWTVHNRDPTARRVSGIFVWLVQP